MIVITMIAQGCCQTEAENKGILFPARQVSFSSGFFPVLPKDAKVLVKIFRNAVSDSVQAIYKTFVWERVTQTASYVKTTSLLLLLIFCTFPL